MNDAIHLNKEYFKKALIYNCFSFSLVFLSLCGKNLFALSYVFAFLSVFESLW